MSTHLFVFRDRSMSARIGVAGIVVIPFFIAYGVIHGTILHGWRVFIAGMPCVFFLGALAYIAVRERSLAHRRSIEIDTDRGSVTFRHFRFVSRFLPEKPRDCVHLYFSEILNARRVQVQKGVYGIEVRTTKGKVRISEEMDHYDRLVSSLAAVIEANMRDQESYTRTLALEPRIQTPWYGWLLLVLGVCAIAGISYLAL